MDRLFKNIPDNDVIKVPDIYWEDLLHRSLDKMSSIGVLSVGGNFQINMMGKVYLLDPIQKCVFDTTTNEKSADSLLVLILLIYLLRAKDLPFDDEWISVKDLKTAHFFRGPHELYVQPLINKFGKYPKLFKEVGQKINAEFLKIADIAFSVSPLPKIRFAYLLWEGEEGVFLPEINVLFDASIEKQIPPDTIWALVGWMTDYLYKIAISIEQK